MKQRTVPRPFNAVSLRVFALVFMALDHMWGTVIAGNMWMHLLGRLAFPIFAFQIAEGYYHTKNVRNYALRLLIFGVLSEIPFNLMLTGSWFFPFHQNVMFTLLLGLLALQKADRARQAATVRQRILAGAAAVGLALLADVFLVDYGSIGVLTILVFGLFRNFRGARLCQLAGMVVLHILLMKGLTLNFGPISFPAQGLAVGALALIWLYNGQQGPRSRGLQIFFYLFYPLHMLLLFSFSLF